MRLCKIASMCRVVLSGAMEIERKLLVKKPSLGLSASDRRQDHDLSVCQPWSEHPTDHTPLLVYSDLFGPCCGIATAFAVLKFGGVP